MGLNPTNGKDCYWHGVRFEVGAGVGLGLGLGISIWWLCDG